MATNALKNTSVSGRIRIESDHDTDGYRRMNEWNEKRSIILHCTRPRNLIIAGMVFVSIICAVILWATVKYAKGVECSDAKNVMKTNEIINSSTEYSVKGLDCSDAKNAMKTNKVHVEANATPFVLSQCLNGWMRNNGSCYLFKLKRKSWTEAMVECETYGAKLAEVSSPSENEFLKSIIEMLQSHGHRYKSGKNGQIRTSVNPRWDHGGVSIPSRPVTPAVSPQSSPMKYARSERPQQLPTKRQLINTLSETELSQTGYGFWVGASDAEVEGVWKWVSSDVSLTFADWSTGEPNNYKNEDCMEIRNSWNDIRCEEENNYICEQNKEN